MKAFTRFLYILSLAAFCVACGGGGGGGGTLPPPPPPTADYTVLQLDPLPGHTISTAHDLNDMGQIVGTSAGGDVPRTAVLWTIDGTGVVTVQDLGTLPGGTRSTAYGINNLGQVVGLDFSMGNRPFIWTASGGMRDLGVPVSVVGGVARRINDAGQVVGIFSSNEVAIWTVDADGNVLDERSLGNLGGVEVRAFDNNAQGNIVGDIFFATGTGQTAFFWSEADGVVEIDTEEALGINDFNEVVGVRTTSGNDAYVWSAAGGLTEISGGIASAINNSVQVTGRPNGPGGPAFLWEDGVYKNLPMPENRDFGWGLSINEAGWIVGFSESDVDGISHANLWMPN